MKVSLSDGGLSGGGGGRGITVVGGGHAEKDKTGC